ncbi:MAG: glutamate 5-kinase [Deltaproteobacteria bacterium]|nr:MAG: glutamate 5-kinase [Deltaproteobacteria bacterium]
MLSRGAVKRVVVKVGSGVLAEGGTFDGRVLGRLAGEMAAARARHVQVILVSSGAVALGVEALGLKRRPGDLVGLQAAAAVGQARLVDRWSRAFARRGVRVAQVLLTHADLDHRGRYLNARHTLARLLRLGVLPIVNENDSVAVEEIRLGDNDLLASVVTGLVGADLLVLLTDVDGLYDADPAAHPGARRLERVSPDDPRLDAFAGGSRSGLGTGGMATKVQAARRASALGVPTVIAAGRAPGVLEAALSGRPEGTLIEAAPEARLSARKSWLAHATKPRGRIEVDAGARAAIVERGKSLLPPGILAVEGTFREGDAVEIAEGGEVFAIGLSVYDAKSVRRLIGARTREIEARLGYRLLDEVVHRDDLVVLRR